MDQVEPLLETAVQGWANLNPRSLEYAQTLTMLGMVKQYLAELDIHAFRDTVAPLYKRALNVYDRSPVPPPPADLALTLELDAQVLNWIGEVQDASLLADRALGIRKERVREIQQGSPREATAFKPGNGISAPVVSTRVEPGYTSEARFLKVKGTVKLRFVVDENGVPQDIVLVNSAGFGLDENAVMALRKWKFLPGKDETGKPLPTLVEMEIRFNPAQA